MSWGRQVSLEGSGVAKSQPDPVLTITELSKYVKISWSTLYKLAQEGKLPTRNGGRHWRFHLEAVNRWLQREPRM